MRRAKRDRQVGLRLNAEEVGVLAVLRKRVGLHSDPEAIRYAIHVLGLQLREGVFEVSGDAVDALARSTVGLGEAR